MRGALARGVWAPLLLAGLTAAFFWKILTAGRAMGGLDVLEYFYPYRAYAAQAIGSGRLPLWNPDTFGGWPFLANIQTGLFYPPTALFYVLSFPAAYTASLLLHTFLGGLFTYLLARQSLHTGRAPALLGAIAFAFGGFLGGQMGHLNQLSAAIWLPALLLCWDKAAAGRPLYLLLGALAVAMQFLAGHSQESYLMLVALLLYAAVSTLVDMRRRGLRALVFNGIFTAILLAAGAALAAVQLVPTSELTSWSIRANGLAYSEAVTFSLKGTHLLDALLPPFWNRALVVEPGGTEFLGYVGLTGLVLALAGVIYSRRRQTYLFLALAAVAFFLALGQQNPLYPLLFRVVPGLNLFRVPARWLFLFGFSTSMLAALGAEAVLSSPVRRNWRPLAAAVAGLAAVGAATARIEDLPPVATRLTWLGLASAALVLTFAALRWARAGESGARGVRIGAAGGLVGLMSVELWLAALSLDYNHPTSASVFEQPLGTIDFLRGQGQGFRVLSVAQDTFAPAAEPAARQQLAPVLGPDGLLAYLSYYKLREILEPNTPAAAGLATIDGYDGGLLPLSRYVQFKNLLTQRSSAPDDRIRFVIKWLPNRPLMDLAGVRYVVADSLNDTAAGGVSYDLSSFIHVDPSRQQATLTLAQPHTASSVGLAFAVKAAPGFPPDAVLATLTLSDGQGSASSIPIPATASQIGQLRYADELPLYALTASLPEPMEVSSATLSLQADSGAEVFLNGLALAQGAGGTAYSPLVAPGRELTRVYQGDVKMYENPSAQPLAFMVHAAQLADTPEAAAMAMDAGFDPAGSAVIEADPQPPPSRSLLGRVVSKLRRSLPNQPAPFTLPQDWLASQPSAGGAPPNEVTVDVQQPERIALRTTSDRPGFLVLAQSFYPGWQATVDGDPAHIMAADTLFQAVHVPAGEHRVDFRFQPRSVLLGGAISAGALLVCLLGLGAILAVSVRR